MEGKYFLQNLFVGAVHHICGLGNDVREPFVIGPDKETKEISMEIIIEGQEISIITLEIIFVDCSGKTVDREIMFPVRSRIIME